MSEKESYELVLVNHTAGITSGCAKCRAVLRSGTWVVGLKIGAINYVVGANPPVTCCGEEKQVLEAFDSEEEARVLSREVQMILNEQGSTENLILYQAVRMISEATH
ncbi:MAG: hypothetical protein V4682_03070 [Patescibacteria group bacterium]